MKTISQIFYGSLAAADSLVAQAENRVVSGDNSATAACMLGNIPDGIPPLPEPPKSKLIIPAMDVLESKAHPPQPQNIVLN